MEANDQSKTILVLTDFTNSALNAADYALFLASQLKTNILLYHSYYIPSTESECLQITNYGLLAETSKSNLQKEMNRLNISLKASGSKFNPQIDYLSEGGSFTDNVCSIIDERKNILMLIMSGFKVHNDDILFGTEITAVVSKARCPVVIVPEVEFLRV